MVLNHLLWDPGPMNVVIRRGKNYLAKKKCKKPNSTNFARSAFFREIRENYARNDELCQKL